MPPQVGIYVARTKEPEKETWRRQRLVCQRPRKVKSERMTHACGLLSTLRAD